jgi:hypothetical protein
LHSIVIDSNTVSPCFSGGSGKRKKEMKKKLTALLVLILVTTLYGMGQKPAGAKMVRGGMDFSLEDVEQLSTGSSWQITLEEGSRSRVHIDQAGDRRGWLYYDGRELRFGVDPRMGIHLGPGGYRATVTVPRLPESLQASSSSAIEADFQSRTDRLEATVSSSARIYVERIQTGRADLKGSSSASIEIGELLCDKLAADLSSSARITLEGGSASELDTSLSSSSRFMAEDFLVRDSFRVYGSSSSKQEFRVREDTEGGGNLSSSSKLTVYGDPAARALQGISLSSSARIIVE